MKRISKIIFILSVCTCIGNGICLQNVTCSTPASDTKVEVLQHRPHPNRPIPKVHIMNERDFQFLYKTIKKKSFDKDRLELLSVGVLDNHFSCRQCAQLMSIFSFDNDKLEVLDIMAEHIVDIENAAFIFESITFESNREKAAKKLRIHRHHP